MRRTLLAAFACLIALATPAVADGSVGARETLGFGRLLTNDFLGDGKDRWRTGSYALSLVWGPEWSGRLPKRFGSLIEYRLRTEIITPDKLNRVVADDRQYIGAASLGVHTHFLHGGTELSFGADLVFVGEQTRIGKFQKNFHDWVDAAEVEILDDQLGNNAYLTGLMEIAQPYRLNHNLTIRPYFEAQVGVENLLRIGGDMHWGLIGQDDFWIRDVATGQRYRAIASDEMLGVALTFGGDVTFVSDSIYLQESGRVTLKETRYRLRVGVTFQGLGPGVFYGLTYLGEEFEEQDGSQLVGSIRVSFRF